MANVVRIGANDAAKAVAEAVVVVAAVVVAAEHNDVEENVVSCSSNRSWAMN